MVTYGIYSDLIEFRHESLSKPDGFTFKQNTDLTAVAFRLINYDLPSGIGGFLLAHSVTSASKLVIPFSIFSRSALIFSNGLDSIYL